MKPNKKAATCFFVKFSSAFDDMGVNFHPEWNNRKVSTPSLEEEISYGKRWRIGDTFQPPLLQRTMICRERKFTAPDEEMLEGWGRVPSPATARIRPEFRFLRNQTKRTQKCDKIKAKPTLRCNLKIVCSKILLNCSRHLSPTEAPPHCSSRSSVSDKLCKRPCFASCCSVQPNDYFQTTLAYP